MAAVGEDDEVSVYYVVPLALSSCTLQLSGVLLLSSAVVDSKITSQPHNKFVITMRYHLEADVSVDEKPFTLLLQLVLLLLLLLLVLRLCCSAAAAAAVLPLLLHNQLSVLVMSIGATVEPLLLSLMQLYASMLVQHPFVVLDVTLL
jgi:hypothetical protein